MSRETYLYLYEHRARKRLYVGIADEMGRVWQDHNGDAVELREAAGTQILQTVEPFSTREDALKAEAIAIHVAMLAGMTVEVAGDVDVEDGRVLVTNRAGVKRTSALGPAVLRREGSIDYSELRRTAIVTISDRDLEGRRGPYGGREAAEFSERARQYWRVGAAKQGRVERLIAILSGSRGLILGDWDVDPSGGYGPDGDVFPLVDPADDDPRGVKGMRLTGVRGQSGRIYSGDLRR